MKPLPKDYTIVENKISICQKEDCCGRDNEHYQDIVVEFLDGGGGFYPVISSERWAFDDTELWNWILKYAEELSEQRMFNEKDKSNGRVSSK